MTLVENGGVTVMAGAAEVVEFQATLPVLIERASRTLLDAKSSAEVLEARDMARVAYDAAKSAGRIAKAKKAHDEVLAAVHRAQADALLVEARAKMRLADEYDGAQERGEVQQHGGKKGNVGNHDVAPSAADLGLHREEIREARQLRDAEKASPGKAERVLKDMTARGEEPTKAKLKREMAPEAPAKEPAAPVDPERRKLAKLTPEALIDEVLGLRADLADAKAEIAKLKTERNTLKAQVSQLSAKDSNTVIRELQIAVKNAESARWREGEKTKDALRKVHALNKEIKRLGGKEIPL